jgi:hypothetical protein
MDPLQVRPTTASANTGAGAVTDTDGTSIDVWQYLAENIDEFAVAKSIVEGIGNSKALGKDQDEPSTA